MNAKQQAILAKMQKRLNSMSVADLCKAFEATNEDSREEIPVIRGWIQDELEKRNPEAFEAWMMDENPENSWKPTAFFNSDMNMSTQNKKVKPVEVKKTNDGYWVRFSNSKKFVKVSDDNDIILQFIVSGMIRN